MLLHDPSYCLCNLFLNIYVITIVILAFSYCHHSLDLMFLMNASKFLLHSSNYYSVFTPEFFGSKTGNQSLLVSSQIVLSFSFLLELLEYISSSFFFLFSFLNVIYLVNQLLFVAFHPNHCHFISLSLTLQ